VTTRFPYGMKKECHAHADARTMAGTANTCVNREPIARAAAVATVSSSVALMDGTKRGATIEANIDRPTASLIPISLTPNIGTINQPQVVAMTKPLIGMEAIVQKTEKMTATHIMIRPPNLQPYALNRGAGSSARANFQRTAER